MKSIARREFVATNGNTVRFDISPDGDLKVSILKNGHFQGVGQIVADTAPLEVVKFVLDSAT